MPSPPASVYETILYATDVPAAAEFYRDVIGLRLLARIPKLSSFRADR